MSTESRPLVVVLMGSKSDWETMRHAAETLTRFGIPHESRVISAHRAPAALTEYVSGAEARGVEVIIAGAGGAAHLAGVTAAQTLVPVLGVLISGAVCVLIALFQGWVLALVVLAYFVIVHVVEGDLIGPRVMGRAVGKDVRNLRVGDEGRVQLFDGYAVG